MRHSMSYECDGCGCELFPNSQYPDRRVYHYNGERFCLDCFLEEAGIERE